MLTAPCNNNITKNEHIPCSRLEVISVSYIINIIKKSKIMFNVVLIIVEKAIVNSVLQVAQDSFDNRPLILSMLIIISSCNDYNICNIKPCHHHNIHQIANYLFVGKFMDHFICWSNLNINQCVEIIRNNNGINISHSKKNDDVYDVLALIDENWMI